MELMWILKQAMGLRYILQFEEVFLNFEDWNKKKSISPSHKIDFVLKGELKIAKLLIENGADVNAVHADDSGCTPFHRLFRNMEINSTREMAELFIKHGANINLSNEYGYSPFDYAILVVKGKLNVHYISMAEALKSSWT